MSATIDIPPQFEIVDHPLDTQMTISMGPQHPSTHGVLRLELVLDGESVVKATPDIGAMTVFFYCFREREKILNLIEAASGRRLTPSYFRIGGLMMDIPACFERRVKQFLDDFPPAVIEFHKLITGNRIFQKRTQR